MKETTNQQGEKYWAERFRQQFGSPVRDGASVKLTEGSDTMLVSEAEIKAFIAEVEKDAVERERERIGEGLKQLLPKGDFSINIHKALEVIHPTND